MIVATANGILSKLRYFLPKDVCISVNDSLFYSHLCLFGLVYSRKTNIDRLIKLQKICFRIMNFLT